MRLREVARRVTDRGDQGLEGSSEFFVPVPVAQGVSKAVMFGELVGRQGGEASFDRHARGWEAVV